MKALKANPPKTEAEQQARVKQLQGAVRRERQKGGRGGVPPARPQERARRADRGTAQAAGGKAPQRRRHQRGRRPHHQRHGRAQQDDGEAVRRAHGEDGRRHRRHAREDQRIAVLGRRDPPPLRPPDLGGRARRRPLRRHRRGPGRRRAARAPHPARHAGRPRAGAGRPAPERRRAASGRSSAAARARTRSRRSVPGARFDDLGHRRPSSIPEPTRSLLLNAGDERDAAPHHRRGRRRAVGGVRTQGHQGGGGEARDRARTTCARRSSRSCPRST